MQVETFECEQTSQETPEMSEEAISIIEKLGLEGQKEMLAAPTSEAPRSPYRQMTKDERLVYSTLCPRHFKLVEYRLSPIPVRVLQVAAHADSLGLFDEIQVWDRESATIVDPVLVATKKRGYEIDFFILARWGEELEEFPALLRRATDIMRANVRRKLEEIKRKVSAKLATIDNDSLTEMSVPSFYD